VDVVKRSRVTLAVGLNHRLHPDMLELTRRAREGVLYPIAAEDVLHGVAVLEAAIQSAQAHQSVQVSD
jgi:predicted dehydrogenase